MDAATFLMESVQGLSPTEASDVEFGNAALKRIDGLLGHLVRTCIASLPQMRGLAEKYPEDQFEILGISFDAELETVTDFMEDRSMPWVPLARRRQQRNGHGLGHPGLPTYVVIDRDGVILSRGHNLDAAAKAIELAVNGEA